jgi:hypothetical protein
VGRTCLFVCKIGVYGVYDAVLISKVICLSCSALSGVLDRLA